MESTQRASRDPFEPPEPLNIASWFLEERLAEGHGAKTALIAGERRVSYAEVDREACQIAHALEALGVDAEQRVLIGLPDQPEFASALFGTLKRGAVVVMVNCHLKSEDLAYFFRYTRAQVAFVHADQLPMFQEAAAEANDLRALIVYGGKGLQASIQTARGTAQVLAYEALLPSHEASYPTYPTHRDDPAIWLFSGGTTGKPKAVIQTHGSFVNTTELYAKRILGYRASDITLSVPKLYFGYATGSNLLFPFAVGATAILFPERCTADALFAQIRAHRPTILINAPTMVNNMLHHEDASAQDLSCVRLATSAGEALPIALYERFKEMFGVELLDGLGTAEMWHVFITNRPGDVTPGTLGRPVEGFDVKACDDEGREVPVGEVGWLWVRGRSRAIAYHQQMPKTMNAFRGDWYVSGDMIQKNADGTIVYAGRGDDMLKVGGKWLAPSEVENCLLRHELVRECAVVGVVDANGLTKPHAHIVATETRQDLEEVLKQHVREKLEPYKAPRAIFVHDNLPRTHLGKIDRKKLRDG